MSRSSTPTATTCRSPGHPRARRAGALLLMAGLAACSGVAPLPESPRGRVVALPTPLAAAAVAAALAETWPGAQPLDRIAGCAPVIALDDGRFELRYALDRRQRPRACGDAWIEIPTWTADRRLRGGRLRGPTRAGLSAPGELLLVARIEGAGPQHSRVELRVGAHPGAAPTARAVLDALAVCESAHAIARGHAATPGPIDASTGEAPPDTARGLPFLAPLRAALAVRACEAAERRGDLHGASAQLAAALATGAAPTRELLICRARLAESLGDGVRRRRALLALALQTRDPAARRAIAARLAEPMATTRAGSHEARLAAAAPHDDRAARARLNRAMRTLDRADGAAVLRCAWLAIDAGSPRRALHLLLSGWSAAQFTDPLRSAALLEALTHRLGDGSVDRIARATRPDGVDDPSIGPWLAGRPRVSLRTASAPLR